MEYPDIWMTNNTGTFTHTLAKNGIMQQNILSHILNFVETQYVQLLHVMHSPTRRTNTKQILIVTQEKSFSINIGKNFKSKNDLHDAWSAILSESKS